MFHKQFFTLLLDPSMLLTLQILYRFSVQVVSLCDICQHAVKYLLWHLVNYKLQKGYWTERHHDVSSWFLAYGWMNMVLAILTQISTDLTSDWCAWILCQWYVRCLRGKYRKSCVLSWRRVEILSLKYFSSNNKNERGAFWTCKIRGTDILF